MPFISAVAARLESSAEAGVDGSACTFSGAFNSPGVGATTGAVIAAGAEDPAGADPPGAVAGVGGAVVGVGVAGVGVAVAGAGAVASSARAAPVTTNTPKTKVPINNLMPTLLVANVSIAVRGRWHRRTAQLAVEGSSGSAGDGHDFEAPGASG